MYYIALYRRRNRWRFGPETKTGRRLSDTILEQVRLTYEIEFMHICSPCLVIIYNLLLTLMITCML
jgi:hypothetical protein